MTDAGLFRHWRKNSGARGRSRRPPPRLQTLEHPIRRRLPRRPTPPTRADTGMPRPVIKPGRHHVLADWLPAAAVRNIEGGDFDRPRHVRHAVIVAAQSRRRPAFACGHVHTLHAQQTQVLQMQHVDGVHTRTAFDLFTKPR